jgi:hypothetical protein
VRRTFEPVIIEDVYPELDCGRYPVKRSATASRSGPTPSRRATTSSPRS